MPGRKEQLVAMLQRQPDDVFLNFALAMELVPGPTLAELIGRHPLPPEKALPIALQIAAADQ